MPSRALRSFNSLEMYSRYIIKSDNQYPWKLSGLKTRSSTGYSGVDRNEKGMLYSEYHLWFYSNIFAPPVLPRVNSDTVQTGSHPGARCFPTLRTLPIEIAYSCVQKFSSFSHVRQEINKFIYQNTCRAAKKIIILLYHYFNNKINMQNICRTQFIFT